MKNRLILSNLILSQSLTVLLLSFACIYWFPYSLSQFIDFGLHSKLLILTNLTLGPLLVMLIYKEGKKGLKIDMALLVLIQITAFFFGSYSLYQKRPAYAVFTIDRFTLINANNTSPDKIRFDALRINPLTSTKMVFARMPKENNKRNEILWGHLYNNQPDLDGRAEYYEPYLKHINKVLKKSIAADDILKNKSSRGKLQTFLKEHGGTKGSYAYLPLQHKNHDVIWVLDVITAEPVGILDIDPWQFSKPVKNKKTLIKKKRQWLI